MLAPDLRRDGVTIVEGRRDTEKRRRMKKILVKVKPNAKTSELKRAADGSWHARLQARPAEGKANAELVALVAEHFAVPKSRVSIRSGRSGRAKLVEIAD